MHGFRNVTDHAHPVQPIGVLGMTGICGLRGEDDHAAGTDMHAFSAHGDIKLIVKVQKHILRVAAGAHHGIGRMFRPIVPDIDHKHGNLSFPISLQMEEIGKRLPVHTWKLI